MTIALRADLEALEDDVTLELVRASIDEVRARNDRGAAFDSVAMGLGTLDLAASADVVLEGAVPATYGRVTARFASSGRSPAFELRIREGEVTYHVVHPGPIDIDVRCELAATLEASGEVTLDAELDLGEVHAALRESELPPPEDGIVRVDATTAPAAIAAVGARLVESWQLECADDESGAR